MGLAVVKDELWKVTAQHLHYRGNGKEGDGFGDGEEIDLGHGGGIGDFVVTVGCWC